MDITGKITGIKYKVFLSEELQIIGIDKFNINKASSFCLLKDGLHSYAISKWVSPKRTRSYPYERVYNTLNTSKKITVIPVIKDEGFDGDRDFLQWDTVSLMSLLNVFVIFAYYNEAVKNPDYKNKITNFKFKNEYVVSKIKEIEQYHSSALHWNLSELTNTFHSIIDNAKSAYEKISNETNVVLHSQVGIDNFKKQIDKDIETFMRFSRKKAEKAQAREIVTTQPKERLSTFSKAKITITNYLGGQYFFTVDEVLVDENTVYLIESKHSKQGILPSIGDIKDGLLKMILYSNLQDVEINGQKMTSQSVLSLTSTKLVEEITSKTCSADKEKFIAENNFTPDLQMLISTLFREANENNFTVKMGYAK
ncbi:MAG: hypothetical protein LBL13_11770 [Bacteroidales bacterium]|jgi:hypothetical protein|nr:hypothetical protein [Bacteroidales bacterium]